MQAGLDDWLIWRFNEENTSKKQFLLKIAKKQKFLALLNHKHICLVDKLPKIGSFWIVQTPYLLKQALWMQ
jgi:hypothetical protein